MKNQHALEKALLRAAAAGDEEKCAKLLAAGVSANGSMMRFPLIAAAGSGAPGAARVCSMLIAGGADEKSWGGLGLNALHHAALTGSEANIDVFLAAGVDVNTQGRCGSTALHLAARLGKERVVSRLLIAGANINALDRDGMTALDHARIKGNQAAAAVLTSAIERQVFEEHLSSPARSTHSARSGRTL